MEISEEQVPADRFERGFHSLLSLLKDVSKHVCPDDPKAVQWKIGFREGSLLVDFTPELVKPQARLLPLLFKTVEAGVDSVESGTAPPCGFSDKAQANAAKFGAALGDIASITVNGREHRLSGRAVAHVDAWAGVASRDWGTLEGRLYQLSDNNGVLKFAIEDHLTRRSAECVFDEDMLDDVWKAFRHRVSATGLVRYKANGEPVSIEVEDLYVFPEEKDLPSIAEMRGILREA